MRCLLTSLLILVVSATPPHAAGILEVARNAGDALKSAVNGGLTIARPFAGSKEAKRAPGSRRPGTGDGTGLADNLCFGRALV